MSTTKKKHDLQTLERITKQLITAANRAGYSVFVARLKLSPLGGSAHLGGPKNDRQEARLLEFVEKQVEAIREHS
jgi:hypothetical protein